MQRTLGEGVVVIPEGLNGRTTMVDDPHNFLNDGAACACVSAGAISNQRVLRTNAPQPCSVA